MLEVGDLHASYGAVQVLEHVALEVGAKQIVCLLGANGAGKTTTLNCISGIVPVTKGRERKLPVDWLSCTSSNSKSPCLAAPVSSTEEKESTLPCIKGAEPGGWNALLGTAQGEVEGLPCVSEGSRE